MVHSMTAFARVEQSGYAKLAALGWRPPVSFEDSLRETIRWQREHPEWIKP